MEKALEILRKYQKNIASCREKCDEDEAILWDEINKAIAELEEAMKPKTCSTCKLCDYEEGDYAYPCEIRKFVAESTDINSDFFCCNQHEPKDNV